MIFFSTLLLSLFVTIGLIPVLKTVALRVNVVDRPNARKMHSRPMPKIGGIAMAAGALLPTLLWAPWEPFTGAVACGAGIVVFFGFLDDVREFGYKVKLAGQVAAALIVVVYGGVSIKCLGECLPDAWLLPDWVAMPLTVLAIVGVTNAINLADGLDGLAGGISILGFICVAYLAYQNGLFAVALISVAVIGAVFGFLRFNTYPALIFMGDAGSQLLGFLAVTLSLYLTQQGATPLNRMFPLLLLGFPILDTLTVMTERLIKGCSPFVADKNHFHHKLIRLGLVHSQAVVLIYALNGLLVITAFVFRFYSEWLVVSLFLVFSGSILTGFLYADRSGWRMTRIDLLDRLIHGWPARLQDETVLIKICFRVTKAGTPLLLLAACLLPARVPVSIGLPAAGMAAVLIGALILKSGWRRLLLRTALYLMIPFVIYLNQIEAPQWLTGNSLHVYQLMYGVPVFFAVLTLKFTRRRKGFQATPMDFLILLIALIIPNLPGARDVIQNLGLLTTQMIALLFSYEVLIGELRQQVGRLSLYTVIALCGLFGKMLL